MQICHLGVHIFVISQLTRECLIKKRCIDLIQWWSGVLFPPEEFFFFFLVVLFCFVFLKHSFILWETQIIPGLIANSLSTLIFKIINPQVIRRHPLIFALSAHAQQAKHSTADIQAFWLVHYQLLLHIWCQGNRWLSFLESPDLFGRLSRFF